MNWSNTKESHISKGENDFWRRGLRMNSVTAANKTEIDGFDPLRLAGGLWRIDRSPAHIEAAFFQAGEQPGRFAIELSRTNKVPAGISAAAIRARELVQAGLVSPHDPRMIALQEPIDNDVVSRLGKKAGFCEHLGSVSESLSQISKNRESLRTAIGIKKRIREGEPVSYSAAADALGKIVINEAREGNSDALKIAGGSMRHVTECGCRKAMERMSEATHTSGKGEKSGIER